MKKWAEDLNKRFSAEDIQMARKHTKRYLISESSVGKESACNAGDLGLIPESERSSGGGQGNPLQYSCLENPMDRGGDWRATVHEVAKSQA